MKTTTTKAFEFAARHPEYVVLFSQGSSQGDFWWHIRTDGTKSLAVLDEGNPTTSKHREVLASIGPKYLSQATHVVYLCGDRKVRVAISAK